MSRHDCVVVPGWGAFIAHYQSARIDKERGVIVPPCRMVSFNSSVLHNDGLLASSVARREGVGYDAAMTMIASDVDILRHQLEAEGEIAVGRLGIFRKSAGDEPMVFQPAESDALPSVYSGLSEVEAVPVALRVERASHRYDEISSVERRRGSFWRRNAVRVAASIALLIGLGIILSTPVTVDDEPLFASLSASVSDGGSYCGYTAEDRRFAQELAIAIPQQESVGESIAPEPDAAVEDVTDPDSATEDADYTVRFDSNDRYCLVIASLPTRELADQYVAESQESRLGILEQDGKYRIYAATGNTQAESRDAAVMARYPDAWPCRR